MKPDVAALFDETTNTVTYIVADPATRSAAIVDSVLDFDPKSGCTAKDAADRMIETIRARDLSVEWLLETYVHADHLSAAPYLKEKLGGADSHRRAHSRGAEAIQIGVQRGAGFRGRRAPVRPSVHPW